MAILLEIIGAVIVLFGLREVFRDIFHPARSGSLSDFIGRAASLAMRHSRLRTAAGPLALVGTIFSWVLALVGGFGFIYSGLVLQGFLATTPGQGHWGIFLDGLYFSLGSFDTFQTFDVIPRPGWLRLVADIEGLIGISMITASISWMMVLYPALSRMRQFARRTAVLLQAEKRTGLSVVHSLGAPLLDELSTGIIQFRLDIILAPILLNFYTTDEAATISSFLPDMLRLADESSHAALESGIRLAGSQLFISLEALAHTLSERVVDADPNNLLEVFKALQRRDL